MQDFDNPLYEQEYQLPDNELGELLFSVFNCQAGEKLILEFEKMIREPRWNPQEDLNMGLYREGGSQMLRYLIANYEEFKNKSN